jgi:hypothetical protein
MEEVVSAMVIEESRLRMMSGNNPVKSAYTTVAERESATTVGRRDT